MKKDDEYRLSQFFGCYFHQDWDLDAKDWEGVIESFVNGNGPAIVVDTEMVISALLDDPLNEHALNHLVFTVWQCSYDPKTDGVSVRNWLESIRERLRKAITYDQAHTPPDGDRGLFFVYGPQVAALREQVLGRLMILAKSDRLETYHDLGRSLEPALHWRSSVMLDLLDEIAEREHALGRGLLSASAVLDLDHPLPASHFFTLANKLGHGVTDQEAFWRSQLSHIRLKAREVPSP